jgi:hypothetical protein
MVSFLHLPHQVDNIYIVHSSVLGLGEMLCYLELYRVTDKAVGLLLYKHTIMKMKIGERLMYSYVIHN